MSAARAQICESQAKVCTCHARVFESVGECLRAVDNWYEDNKGCWNINRRSKVRVENKPKE
ncbi:hypothetical protein K440DRAFT_632617 [Wilcoxina mikolae CBS 423.85]|nr:hypothetical protein K440DRAFT_632617 [Wilcoxina mikolae CBS 423.85]